MARVEKVSFQVELTKDQIVDTVMTDPDLQQRVFAKAISGVEQSIDTGKRKSAGSPKRASKGKRVRRGLHHEMAIKALAAVGATNKKGGVERGSVMGAGKNLGHDFGSTLSATLDTLATKGLVSYENISENAKPRYKWWLLKSESDALSAISGGNDDAN